jgi:hypothetical protein
VLSEAEAKKSMQKEMAALEELLRLGRILFSRERSLKKARRVRFHRWRRLQ